MKQKIKFVIAVACAFFALSAPASCTVYAAALRTAGTISSASQTEEDETISLQDCKISLSKVVYTYSGKEKKPNVTVYYNSKKLKKNKDFELTYSDNVEIGTASVTITGINNYEGTVTKTFTIFPKTPSSLTAEVSARKIIITWKKVANADGYILYRRVKGTDKWNELNEFSVSEKKKYTDEDCTFGETYEYAVRAFKDTTDGRLLSEYSGSSSCTFQPAATEITEFMPLSKDSVSLKWNLLDEADGYIIYQKINGNWKKVKTIAAYATNHCTIKGLKYRKTYTFAVRAYWKAEDGSIQRGALSGPYKEKLSYKPYYEDGYKLYYDASGDLITDVDGIIGPQDSYTISISRVTNTVTVYAVDPENAKYTIPVKTFLCSTGKATPVGTYKTSTKYRWHALIHSVYGQWCTRITGSILFHSVYYAKSSNANTLDVTEFNKLGTAASAGCIRLNCADVKWIYDNCGSKTTVILTDDENPGPFGYPDQLILDDDHTWDPTDPEMKYLCQENGCHQE